MTSFGGRVLVIGLDVGDGELVEAWAEAGELPVLRGLIERGSFGRLTTTAETLHVSAWPSLYTGASPGRHGVYYTHQPAAGEQGAVRFRPDQYGCDTVWEAASAAGKRCVVLDAPYTHPARSGSQDGGSIRQVFEWGTWAHYWKPSAVPAPLYGQLERACGGYPLGYEANDIGLSALEPEKLAPKLIAAAAAKADATRWMMDAGDWDLCVSVFSETHPAAHYLWPEGREGKEASSAAQDFDGLRRVYAAVDRAIGEVLHGVGADDTVLVVSGDGGGPNRAGWHLLPAVLEKLGFLVSPSASTESASDAGNGQVAESEPSAGRRPSLYGRLRGLISPELRQAVSRYLPTRLRDALMKRNEAAAVDWSRTRAFCLPTDLEGCLRLNVRGREPEGIVEPGEEYERVCAELSAALERMENPSTGRAAVRRVVRTDDVYAGPRRDQLPDLMVLWAEEAAIDELRSPEIGIVTAPSPDRRLGTHRPPGFVIARGPGFGAGVTLDGADVLDLAPTVLSLLGAAVPDHMEGRPWVGPARP